MARPGKSSADIPLRLTVEGKAAIEMEAEALNVDNVEMIRLALREYFEKRGKSIEFTPRRKGGARPRKSEFGMAAQVLERVKALGLPIPQIEYKLRHKVYDLAWPDQQAAVEISAQKRPADSNGWMVGHIKPGDDSSKIDKVLKALPLT